MPGAMEPSDAFELRPTSPGAAPVRRPRHRTASGGSSDNGGEERKDGDLLVFAPEDEDDSEHAETEEPWVVLIVDDDRNVHQATLLALAGESVLGRPLHFLHAHSAAEARDLIAKCPNISVVLLDVVMETPNAGLELVPVIRETLGRRDTRIVLRTGQPGETSEQHLRGSVAIDAYLLKSRLTRRILLETLETELSQFQSGRTTE